MKVAVKLCLRAQQGHVLQTRFLYKKHRISSALGLEITCLPNRLYGYGLSRLSERR